MSGLGRSRWADDDEDSAEVIAQKKLEKEQRKRAKEEKQGKLRAEEEVRIAAAQSNEIPTTQDAEDGATAGRPSKRRRLPGSEAVPNEAAEATLLRFQTAPLRSCGDVENYERLNDIEEGSYGWVSRARDNRTGEVVALKKLKMDYANDGFPVTGIREIQTLMASRHLHIVTLREVVMGSTLKDVYLVMDFLEHDLKTLLDDMVEPFLPSETKTLMLQLTSATSYLHAHWIMHRDLKTSNLLINNRGELKIADFGMARYTGSPPPKLTATVVTLWYRAPELLLGETAYDFSIDIWSLGCIFGELLTKDPLFQGKNEVDQLSRIFSLLGPPDPKTWPEFRRLPNSKALHPLLSRPNSSNGFSASTFPYLSTSGLSLLSSLLSLNPSLRPTASNISSHQYFKEDPRPKPKEMFPTFPSKAGQERRRKRDTPNAPERGEVVRFGEEDVKGLFGGRGEEERGGGFALRLG